ncbi:major facilitator superfamily domain-containing protein [Scheffersomyces xylosifermentans]|uniref:major facilitator superfamily domain-containing protein n=1 Tax=Scheffersomyces xylosifermentans TaxID=1304137 RepID=UPI00315CED46
MSSAKPVESQRLSSIDIDFEPNESPSEPSSSSTETSLGIDPAFSKKEKFSIIFDDELIYVDSINWRSSNLLKLQILASYTMFILFGLAEQTMGTIIPVLQQDYKVNDLQISLVFVFSVSGYFVMALSNDFTHKALGIRGVVVLGSTVMTFGYLIESTRPPFLVFCVCYFMGGIGFGSLDAGLNGWVGSLHDSNQLLGILHGCYGIGCMISPPLITHLLERKENPWAWNHFYIVLSIIGGFCVSMLILTFKYETPKKYKFVAQMKHESRKRCDAKNRDEEHIELESFKKLSVEISDNEVNSSDSVQEETSVTLLGALKSRLVWIFALILFIYVGGEVSFGTWIITYLIRVNKLPYKMASYMATSFWFGLTVGRIVLGFVTAHYFKTELLANFVYILGSFIGYLFFWIFAGSKMTVLLFITVFFTGLFVGPIFPTTIVTSIKVLPPKYHTSGIGFVCAFGGGGAAGLPFLIGLIAESSDIGMKIMPLLIVLMFGVLVVLWAGIMKRYSASYGRNAL